MFEQSQIESLCMGCFTKHEKAMSVCPICGYDEDTKELPLHLLRPRTVLNGKYVLGRVLGEGGFGITYIGWDTNLDMKVAIKEYYPAGCVSRETTTTLTVQQFTGAQGEFFLKSRDKFINEAKTLAKFFSLPGIVTVKDYFMENATAYIVMEYIDGETLKDYLTKRGGRLPANQILSMMKPIMTSLAEIHETGLIHRDIAPDNIMITKSGHLKLLDFGAARDFTDSGNKSLSIMLKPGYAPEEQYRTKGVQGPWTDVYALSATMYRCITGIRPDESMERIISDQVKSPSEMGIAIGKPQELALMRGMAVLMANRFQSIPLLYSAMYGAVPIGEDVHIKAEHPASVQHKAQPGGNQDMRTEYANPRGHTQMENSKNGFGSAQPVYQPYEAKKAKPPKKKLWLIAAVPACIAVIVAAVIIVLYAIGGGQSNEPVNRVSLNQGQQLNAVLDVPVSGSAVVERTGELLFSGMPLHSAVNVPIADFQDTFGLQYDIQDDRSGTLLLYEDYVVNITDGVLVNFIIALEPRVLTFDGAAMDKDANGIIGVLGYPTSDGWNPNQQAGAEYIMEYVIQGGPFPVFVRFNFNNPMDTVISAFIAPHEEWHMTRGLSSAAPPPPPLASPTPTPHRTLAPTQSPTTSPAQQTLAPGELLYQAILNTRGTVNLYVYWDNGTMTAFEYDSRYNDWFMLSRTGTVSEVFPEFTLRGRTLEIRFPTTTRVYYLYEDYTGIFGSEGFWWGYTQN